MRPRRRLEQFFRALAARVTDEDREEAASVLGPNLLPLFFDMTTWDQRHGLAVCRALERRGFGQRELLQAALIHDCGKAAAAVKLWHRVAAVLMKALLPGVWQSEFWKAPGTWRYPVYVYRKHPSLGSSMAEEAGCSALVACLIRFHEDHRGGSDICLEEGWLEALQVADREA